MGINNTTCEVLTFRQSQDEEEQELINFFNSTNGNTWTNMWNISSTLTEWYGITPIDLVLANNPTTHRTRELNLTNNNVSGIIPNLKLPLLEILDLSENNFGSGLPDFRYLWNIKTIDLHDSNLIDVLPPFTNCTELEYLYLQDNELTGELHDFLMPDLLTLDISSNQLTGSILDFSYLPKLEILALENNEFEGAVPEFQYLTELTNLFLQNNSLDGLIPDLSSKEFLGYVDLRNNKFTFEDILPNLAQNEAVINTFHYAPQQQVGEELEIDVALNGDYTLCVDIDHGVTTSTYKWYKGTTLIATTSVNEYTLEDLQYSDDGTYHCQITNPNAPDLTLISKNITINIIEEVAPDIIWSTYYGGVDTSGIAHGVSVSNDNNGYVICGECGINGSDNRYCVRKVNRSGDIIWERDYGGSVADRAYGIVQSNDGQGYLVIGSSSSDDGHVSGNNGLADLWLLAIDEDGEYLWDQNYGGSNTDIGIKIIPSNDQTGYVLLGWTASNEIQRFHGYKDYWVTKITNNGTELWSKAFGGTLLDEPKSIIPAIEGDGYIVVGYTRSDDGDLPNILGNTTDAWYFKLSEDGNIIWQNSYNAPGSQLLAEAVTQNIMGDGYIVAATAYGPYISISSPNSIVYSVFETTISGEVNWIKYHPTYNSIGINDICTSNEQNGYIVVGNQHPFGQFWKVDIHGNWFWSRSSGQSSNAIVSNIDEDGYIIVGMTPPPFDWWAFQLDGLAPLPVELTSFTGETRDDKNILHWRTLSEENTDRFIIERSIDGRNWQPIGEKKAVGNSTVLQSYSFVDSAPLEKGYYRLRVIDYDGSTSYSEIIYLEQDIIQTFMITGLFPNPATHSVSVQFSHPNSQSVSYSLINILGEKIKIGSKEVSNQVGEFSISLSDISTGVYILQLESGNESIQQKLVKR